MTEALPDQFDSIVLKPGQPEVVRELSRHGEFGARTRGLESPYGIRVIEEEHVPSGLIILLWRGTPVGSVRFRAG